MDFLTLEIIDNFVTFLIEKKDFFKSMKNKYISLNSEETTIKTYILEDILSEACDVVNQSVQAIKSLKVENENLREMLNHQSLLRISNFSFNEKNKHFIDKQVAIKIEAKINKGKDDFEKLINENSIKEKNEEFIFEESPIINNQPVKLEYPLIQNNSNLKTYENQDEIKTVDRLITINNDEIQEKNQNLKQLKLGIRQKLKNLAQNKNDFSKFEDKNYEETNHIHTQILSKSDGLSPIKNGILNKSNEVSSNKNSKVNQILDKLNQNQNFANFFSEKYSNGSYEELQNLLFSNNNLVTKIYRELDEIETQILNDFKTDHSVDKVKKGRISKSIKEKHKHSENQYSDPLKFENLLRNQVSKEVKTEKIKTAKRPFNRFIKSVNSLTNANNTSAHSMSVDTTSRMRKYKDNN